ncbi:TIGR00303 family protein [Phormidium sp. CLA17]|uniref:nicotinate mononucleotide-dependent phosphoribosyltransferase CobT n=1 Tax=Leptolyngbya sp. Cla-17 TaxID=2803751 RepID=UPI001491EF33|nr:TIGR00303 family protein [Leptolyngbya sp. Cla-17]MBM0743418.1 TIGR00303 family protein [Leptolyngbya sp. Cla-17]
MSDAGQVNANDLPAVRVYTQIPQGQAWLERHRGKRPVVACVLGFTETGLIPGISAAGATPDDRRYTAIADAEFLVNGVQPQPTYSLPPLHVGASPVFISRAVVEGMHLPVYLFNAGLPQPTAVPAIDLQGVPARCLSTGEAMEQATVEHLFTQGLLWGEKLAIAAAGSYVILAECVVGGTTTALAVLTGLGIAAAGKVNSSHPTCNHDQKWKLVKTGLEGTDSLSPWSLLAAVGDPMQAAVAGMAIAASRMGGVLLAGGTQMLAVYALARAIVQQSEISWQPQNIVVGTTRWVADDPTGDTVGLAQLVAVPLIATQLSFADSRFAQLRAYEQGYVKEGVGAGGCAIAAHLYQGWKNSDLLHAVESIAAKYQQKNEKT